MNLVFLVGQVIEDVTFEKIGDMNLARIKIEVQRDFKNREGLYLYDVFLANLWSFNANFARDNVKKGQFVTLKGRINVREFADTEGVTHQAYEIIGDRLTIINPNNREFIEEEITKE